MFFQNTQMHRFALLLSLLLLCRIAGAALPADTTAKSNNRPAFSLGLRSHYGFIIPHSSTIRQVSWSEPWGLELDAALLLTGDRAWDYCF